MSEFIGNIYNVYGIFPFIVVALVVVLLFQKSSNKSKAETIKRQEEQIDSLRTRCEEQNNKIKNIQSNVETLYKDLKSSEKENSSTQRKLKEMELYRENCVKYEKEIAELHESQKSIKTKLDACSNKREDLEKELATRNAYFKRIMTSNLEAIPYLAGLMADYLTYDLEVLANQLHWGHSIQRSEKEVKLREIRRQTREELEIAKEAEYQLAYLKQLYPEIEEIIETDYRDSISRLSLEELVQASDARDVVRDYLSKEEWSSLNTAQRNQLALDRYIKGHKKTKWQIGRDYEEYVAYSKYERNGWSAKPTGIQMKLEDLGRDIIATKGKEVHIVQCKYWSKDKVIHEKHIFQLFGTAISYAIEHEGEGLRIVPVFITNISFSNMAKRIAKRLYVELIDNYEIGDYPRIKCNIGKDGEKIYHLPMDQQYDAVVIEPEKGEFKAMTVTEAEAAGFRRAYKWFGQ